MWLSYTASKAASTIGKCCTRWHSSYRTSIWILCLSFSLLPQFQCLCSRPWLSRSVSRHICLGTPQVTDTQFKTFFCWSQRERCRRPPLWTMSFSLPSMLHFPSNCTLTHQGGSSGYYAQSCPPSPWFISTLTARRCYLQLLTFKKSCDWV